MAITNGTSGADTLAGTDFADTIHGLGGDDLIIGYGGADTIYGDDGDDQLWGGTGADTVSGGAGDDEILVGGGDIISGDAGDDLFEIEESSNIAFAATMDGGDGIDIVNFAYYGFNRIIYLDQGAHAGAFSLSHVELINLGDTSSTVYGGAFDDFVLGGSAIDELHGGGGDDLLAGAEGIDWLYGDDGDDLLDGGPGDDIIDGGAGIDYVDYSLASVGLTIDLRVSAYAQNTGLGMDRLSNIEGLYGSDYADYLTGNASANFFDSGYGDDVLDGGEGADELIGGLGNDAYWVDNIGDLVTEYAGEGFDTVASFVSYTLGANIEQLKLVGTVALTATGSSSANILNGNSLDNTLYGLGGDDVLAGEAGADTMIGGLGNDAYWVDNSNDVIVELAGEGFESVAASANYALSANIEQLILLGAATYGAGNADANTITGNALANVLDGQGGADRLVGGLGDDAYWVDNIGDVVVENAGEGFDTIASFVSYTLAANIEQLKLVGTVALTATGSSSANILNGNDLNNTLYGLDGDDVLAGEAGADTMIGGIGNDAYWVDNVGDIIIENAGEGFESVASSVSYTLSANLEQLVLLASAIGGAITGTGNASNNLIYGNVLANTIDGAGGNDILTGGGGADRFVFGPGGGHDRITDFGGGGAHDILDLSAFTGTGTTWNVTQQGANTLVSFSSGDDVVLENVLATGLTHNADNLVWA